jgi:endonuclease/exonuclease/phosphatase family metal-dependent hydrolase
MQESQNTIMQLQLGIHREDDHGWWMPWERPMYTVISTRSIMLALALAFILSAGPAHAKEEQDEPEDKKTVEVVNLNILSGIACNPPFPDDGNQCRVRNRITLLLQHIAAAGCPDLVTLQENVTSEFVQQMTDTGKIVVVGPLDNTVTRIKKRLPFLAVACGFTYRVVFDPTARRPPTPGRGIDEELILTRYPVLAWEVLPLYSPLAPFFFRHVLYARIDHPVGPIDVFTTHLASDSDLGSLPCGLNAPLPPPFESPACPAECVARSDTVRQCQAKQVAAFVEARHDVPEPAIISGDFNAEPDSPEYNEFTRSDRGWIDSHLKAGNLECDSMTGENCTAGRIDNNLNDLESQGLNQTERIDFIFVVPPRPGSTCAGVIQTSDRPGVTSTGLFAAEPNPFAPACGAAPLPICWPSDHSGTALNLSCQPLTDVAVHR